MSRITLDEIKQKVTDYVQRTSLGPSFRGVTIEPEDFDPETMLRATVALHRTDLVNVDDAVAFIQQVQEDMWMNDDRFLVVTFAEAA